MIFHLQHAYYSNLFISITWYFMFTHMCEKPTSCCISRNPPWSIAALISPNSRANMSLKAHNGGNTFLNWSESIGKSGYIGTDHPASVSRCLVAEWDLAGHWPHCSTGTLRNISGFNCAQGFWLGCIWYNTRMCFFLNFSMYGSFVTFYSSSVTYHFLF